MTGGQISAEQAKKKRGMDPKLSLSVILSASISLCLRAMCVVSDSDSTNPFWSSLMHRGFVAILAVVFLLGQSVAAQEPADPSDTDALASVIELYTTSFNARDAKALADLWSEEGVLSDRSTGEKIVGKAAIAEEFERVFMREDLPQLSVETESLDFVSPNVAIEHGIATLTTVNDEGNAPLQSSYSVVYIRQGEHWRIDRVTEQELLPENPGHAALKQLEWLIGDWIDEQDEVTLETSCRWTANETYISRTYKLFSNGELNSSGLQIIGWDPVGQEIRSWLFDSTGTFVSGTWTERDGKWVVQSKATLSDGGRGSFTSIFRPLEDGNYTWEKINQVLDGQLLPSVDETIVRRK